MSFGGWQFGSTALNLTIRSISVSSSVYSSTFEDGGLTRRVAPAFTKKGFAPFNLPLHRRRAEM